jgi:ribosome modulation factor/uncharacterized protein (UPF0335 family)
VADWLRQVRQQRRKVAEENGVLRNIYKRAKADGVDIKAAQDAIEATKRDPDEVIAEMRNKIRYMGILHVKVTAQDFESITTDVTQKTAREDDLWDADEKGYVGGRSGVKVDDAPYEPGTERHVHWMAAWHKGQAAIARELGPDTKVASISRGRPKRAVQTALDVGAAEPVVETPVKAPRKTKGNGGAAPRGRKSAAGSEGASSQLN